MKVLFLRHNTSLGKVKTTVVALADSEFFHLGTVPEILELYLSEKSDEAHRFRPAICFDHTGGVYYSQLSPGRCQLSGSCLMEFCFVDEGVALELEESTYVNSIMLRACELRGCHGNRFKVPR